MSEKITTISHPDGTETIVREKTEKPRRLGCLGSIALVVVAFGPYAWHWPLWIAIPLSVLEAAVALALIASSTGAARPKF